MGHWLARAALIAIALLLSLALRPLSSIGGIWQQPFPNLIAGIVFSLAALAAERAMRTWDIWTAAGGALGVLVGGLVSLVLVRMLPEVYAGALRPFVYLVSVYAGMMGGARFASSFKNEHLPGLVARDGGTVPGSYKILDTSVIIDGRIADVCESGFVEGVLVIPTFVLGELQYIADASDPLRRARGRKGLEILQRVKKVPSVKVIFSQEELPEIREVDLKLIELAQRMGAKLITNDFNLKKVAGLRGIDVLSLTDLANAVKPIVLAGEGMRVQILKEGKEPGQGVAYLEDGTMVVVDHARHSIGRTVEVILTSVLQTTAGKMFFARLAQPEASGREGGSVAAAAGEEG